LLSLFLCVKEAHEMASHDCDMKPRTAPQEERQSVK
jgi:hypothetical protein